MHRVSRTTILLGGVPKGLPRPLPLTHEYVRPDSPRQPSGGCRRTSGDLPRSTGLREAATKHKLGILHVHDLKQTLESKGIELGSECWVYDVCNPQAASKALHAEMRVSTVLPCRISIFSENQGCTIATVRPTSLLEATGLDGVATLATQSSQRIFRLTRNGDSATLASYLALSYSV